PAPSVDLGSGLALSRYPRQSPQSDAVRAQQSGERPRGPLPLILIVGVEEHVNALGASREGRDLCRDFPQLRFRIVVVEALRRAGEPLAVPRIAIAPVHAHD